jgi:hypothetical protein
MEENRHEHHDPNRRSVLEYNGVGGSGHFIGQHKQSGNTKHTDSAHQNGEVKAQLVVGGNQIGSDQQTANDISPAVDVKRLPGIDFTKQTAGGKEDSRSQHHQWAIELRLFQIVQGENLFPIFKLRIILAQLHPFV